MRAAVFQSWLAPHFERFVALKRAGGARYCNQVHLLMQADRFLARRSPCPPLRAADVEAFVSSRRHLSARSLGGSVGVLWQALAHALRHGAVAEPLPPRPVIGRGPQRAAYVLNREEFAQLVDAAQRPRPRHPDYVGVTHRTLFGLLVSTGMRIGEAVALDVSDFDPEAALLSIRCGKFRKARQLVLHETTADALSRYLHDRRRPLGQGTATPFFLSCRRQRLTTDAALRAFRKAASLAGVGCCARKPRLHDLRHTYAAWRLEAWYREGRDVSQLLPALSTYLGHVDPAHTYTYLQAHPSLMAQGALRFERVLDALLPEEQA